MIIQAETAEDQDMIMAKDVADTLHTHYPGHLWAVAVKSGVIIIKALNISSLWGYVLHYKDVCHDAGTRRKESIRAGGEILERAKLARGAYTGQKAVTLDGVADYKPIGVR